MARIPGGRSLDLYLPAAEFGPFLKEQQEQISVTLAAVGISN
jgi:hypothetical protein